MGEAERVVRQRQQEEQCRRAIEADNAAAAERRSQRQTAAVIEALARRAVELLSQQGWPGMTMIRIGATAVGRLRKTKIAVEEIACRRIGEFHYTIHSDDVTAPIYLVSTGQIAYASTFFVPAWSKDRRYDASIRDYDLGFGKDGTTITDGLRRLVAELEA